ncbi:hypothetical protein CC78DRAFT_585986 [Lojkania enalia]|uniref:Uncharacterized protein n=1 Tax=Lojkania enalia TaxID=147567 RepID=A0A9P4K0W3_9PLEO|nr:hypothetical protein CC78DRAFT_585986 [Didymosphaeria enalia]
MDAGKRSQQGQVGSYKWRWDRLEELAAMGNGSNGQSPWESAEIDGDLRAIADADCPHDVTPAPSRGLTNSAPPPPVACALGCRASVRIGPARHGQTGFVLQSRQVLSNPLATSSLALRLHSLSSLTRLAAQLRRAQRACPTLPRNLPRISRNRRVKKHVTYFPPKKRPGSIHKATYLP